MKFTKIPENTFKNIQLNAGILTNTFEVDTQTIGDLLGATSGGINFTSTPTYNDYGDDIDNCPKNMMELKKLESWEAKMSGTFISVTAALGKKLVGAGDLAADGIKIVPRNELLSKDFEDLWWIGDYSEINEDGTEGGTAGFCAIHLLNSLSTGGFQIQSNDKGKGNFSFEFTGHYSMKAQDVVPFEIYIKQGEAD